MKPGWYILNYHNVDWEDSVLTRALGATTRPDVFADHLEQLAGLGRFVSVPEGQAMLAADALDEPVFSLWFDDGFAGVREFAWPLCRQYGIAAAMSVCSRLLERREMYWRAKLSYLVHADGLRYLRSRLRQTWRDVPLRVRNWTIEHFDLRMAAIIDEVYQRFAPAWFTEDGFRIFDTEEGIGALRDDGWLITNHGAAHYPAARTLAEDEVLGQFLECEELVRRYEPANRYWVLPFGYCAREHAAAFSERITVVDVGERANTFESWRRTGRLFRFDAPRTRQVGSYLG